MKQHIAEFVCAEMLQAAEAILDVLDETFWMLGVELLQRTTEKRVGSMGKSDERSVVAGNDGCIHHPLYMVYATGTAEVLE